MTRRQTPTDDIYSSAVIPPPPPDLDQVAAGDAAARAAELDAARTGAILEAAMVIDGAAQQFRSSGDTPRASALESVAVRVRGLLGRPAVRVRGLTDGLTGA